MMKLWWRALLLRVRYWRAKRHLRWLKEHDDEPWQHE
jgi:hypothetical protein